VTPVEAIRKAAETASLQWKKIGDKSYLVGKVLRDGSGSSSAGSDSGSRAIEPIDNGWLSAPKLPSGSLSVLPQYGNNGGGTPSDSLVPLNRRPERKDRKIVP